MDSQAVVEQIVRSLSFEVEAVPKTKTVELTTSSNSTPLNVKIRVRKKDDLTMRHGVISIPKFDDPEQVPQKIRLVNSDQTIMSFDVFMEAEIEKKPLRKPRKHLFDMLKPGICLGPLDDDDYTYMPSSSYSANVTEGNTNSRADGVLKHNFTLSKNTYDEYGDPTKEKTFLGKCKPGGCLDPPFGEDKYSYKPVIREPLPNYEKTKKDNVQDSDAKCKGRRSSVFDSSIFKKKRKTSDQSTGTRGSNSMKGNQSNSILNLYQVESTVNSLSTTQSNSIITYPPALTSSDLPINVERNRSRASSEDKTRKSFNEFIDAYFIPPKRLSKNKDNKKDMRIDADDNHSQFQEYDKEKRKSKPIETLKVPMPVPIPVPIPIKSETAPVDDKRANVGEVSKLSDENLSFNDGNDRDKENPSNVDLSQQEIGKEKIVKKDSNVMEPKYVPIPIKSETIKYETASFDDKTANVGEFSKLSDEKLLFNDEIDRDKKNPTNVDLSKREIGKEKIVKKDSNVMEAKYVPIPIKSETVKYETAPVDDKTANVGEVSKLSDEKLLFNDENDRDKKHPTNVDLSQQEIGKEKIVKKDSNVMEAKYVPIPIKSETASFDDKTTNVGEFSKLSDEKLLFNDEIDRDKKNPTNVDLSKQEIGKEKIVTRDSNLMEAKYVPIPIKSETVKYETAPVDDKRANVEEVSKPSDEKLLFNDENDRDKKNPTNVDLSKQEIGKEKILTRDSNLMEAKYVPIPIKSETVKYEIAPVDDERPNVGEASKLSDEKFLFNPEMDINKKNPSSVDPSQQEVGKEKLITEDSNLIENNYVTTDNFNKFKQDPSDNDFIHVDSSLVLISPQQSRKLEKQVSLNKNASIEEFHLKEEPKNTLKPESSKHELPEIIIPSKEQVKITAIAEKTPEPYSVEGDESKRKGLSPKVNTLIDKPLDESEKISTQGMEDNVELKFSQSQFSQKSPSFSKPVISERQGVDFNESDIYQNTEKTMSSPADVEDTNIKASENENKTFQSDNDKEILKSYSNADDDFLSADRSSQINRPIIHDSDIIEQHLQSLKDIENIEFSTDELISGNRSYITAPATTDTDFRKLGSVNSTMNLVDVVNKQQYNEDINDWKSVLRTGGTDLVDDYDSNASTSIIKSTKDKGVMSPDKRVVITMFDAVSTETISKPDEIPGGSKNPSSDLDKSFSNLSKSYVGSASVSSSIPSTSTLKSALKKETVAVDLAFQSYLNERNERVFKTLDSSTESKRYLNDSITLVKSQVRLSSNEIRVPIDSENDMLIHIKKASVNQHVHISESELETDTKHEMKDSDPKCQYDMVDREFLHDTLVEIYDQELVPLQMIIKNLKDEIDILASQQMVFKEKIFSSKRSKPARVVHTNRRCGCLKKI